MHTASWRSAYRGILPDAYLDGNLEAERLQDWAYKLPALVNGDGLALIAEIDGEPLGLACAMNADADGSVLLDQLHVLPAAKGRGLGSALIDAVENWARASDADSMHLLVLSQNAAAIGFYESRGWRRSGMVKAPLGGIIVAAFRYELTL
ncbi:GNAT family N-acetyltransferase [Chitinasiproducens palmae]|nr:GNAT family N-acetyltransferase [Chitinasiproducens palmae]